MNAFMGNIELACIAAVSQAEVNGGRVMSEQERKLFKIGFLAGAWHGIEVAKMTMTDVHEASKAA